ncbi:hypothetical protein OAL23_00280 [bacterium]|nr:hypothetical protein [bacterium]
MKFLFVFLLGATATATLHAAQNELVKAKDGSGVFGYKDAPKLPRCEWFVHDPDRPLPPEVKPGKPIAFTPPPTDTEVLFDGKNLSKWAETD